MKVTETGSNEIIRHHSGSRFVPNYFQPGHFFRLALLLFIIAVATASRNYGLALALSFGQGELKRRATDGSPPPDKFISRV